MSRTPDRARRRYARDVVLVAALLAGAGVAAALRDEAAVRHLGLAAAGLLGALAALSVLRRPETTRRVPWVLLGAAGLTWTAGELGYGVALLAGAPEQAPTSADAGHLASAVLVVASLLTMAGARRGATAVIGAVLDGALIAGSLLAVSWILVAGPAYYADDADGLAQLAAVAYPIVGLLTGSVAAYAVLSGRRGRRVPLPTLTLVSAGALFLAISDSSWGSLLATDTVEPTAVVTAGWLAGWLAIVAGARHPRAHASAAPPPVDARPLTLGSVLPFVAILVGVTAGVADAVRRGEPSRVVAAIGAALLVVCTVRLVVHVVETSRFAADLETRVAARAAEVQVREERFRALVARSSDVVTVIRVDGVIGYQSPSVTRVLGCKPEELVGRTVASLLHPQDRSRFHALLDRVRDEPDVELVAELRMNHRDGGYRITETTIANLLRERSVRGIVLNSRDITDRRQLERALEHQTLHDPLTGLANRALFRDSVTHALSSYGRRPRTIAVVHIDLNAFGRVNDEQGNEFGDDVLRGIGALLRAELRDHDVVSRLGGDEFAVLLDDAESRDAIAGTVVRLLSALQDGVEVSSTAVPVPATAGVAIADAEDSVDGLLRNAELALHRAKADPALTWSFYDTVMHATVDVRRGIEEDLRGAAERGELVLHYQPTVELATGRIRGVEALVQWAHPTRGLLAPMTFIPLAEESGVILEIGGWVLEEACRQGAEWQRRYGVPGGAPLEVYVNVSARQLHAPEFARMVAWQVNSSEIHPYSLILETSESVLVDGADAMRDMLIALKAMGVRLAIDDFGTGYQSLSYLDGLPVDVVKIDRSFVELLDHDLDHPDAAHALSVVQTAYSLGLQLVAEGVETREQLRTLLESGCEQGQGFLFHRPVPAVDLERSLATQFALGAAGEPVLR